MPPSSPRVDFQVRLEDMRRAEYGSRIEVIARFAIMGLVIVVLLVTLAPRVAIIWGAAYSLFEIGMALALMKRGTGWAGLRYGLALACYGLSGLVFMSLPLYLVAADISAGLTFAGAAGMVGLVLYSLQRTQREIGLVIADCLQVSVMALALVVIMQPMLDGWVDRFLVIFIALALLGYYIASLVAGWRLQCDLREAQRRYASAQMARALSQFVGGVAHDFNNQLTAVLGNLELAETLGETSERRAALRESHAAASRAAMTVQQLMATSGRTRLSPVDLPMETFLFDLGEILADTLAAGITVDISPPGDALVARADRDMLETCAIQLCLNAQEAMGGHGTLRLSVERRATAEDVTPAPDAAPPYIALIVEDDGPGVSDEALPLLAEPFYTTKPPNEGSGLGLSSVAGFARQSGGALTLEKALRGGLRAILYLPEAAGRGTQLPP